MSRLCHLLFLLDHPLLRSLSSPVLLQAVWKPVPLQNGVRGETSGRHGSSFHPAGSPFPSHPTMANHPSYSSNNNHNHHRNKSSHCLLYPSLPNPNWQYQTITTARTRVPNQQLLLLVLQLSSSYQNSQPFLNKKHLGSMT